MYCVPIALLRQNKPFRLLYLGHAQIKMLWRPASMCPFQNGSSTSGILNKSTVSAKFTCDGLESIFLGQRLSKKLFWRPASMCLFQNGSSTSGILIKSTVPAKFTCDGLCGESESYWERVMWWYFALIKCGNIVSSWLWIVISVLRTWLIVWFRKVVDRDFRKIDSRSVLVGHLAMSLIVWQTERSLFLCF